MEQFGFVGSAAAQEDQDGLAWHLVLFLLRMRAARPRRKALTVGGGVPLTMIGHTLGLGCVFCRSLSSGSDRRVHRLSGGSCNSLPFFEFGVGYVDVVENGTVEQRDVDHARTLRPPSCPGLPQVHG